MKLAEHAKNSDYKPETWPLNFKHYSQSILHNKFYKNPTIKLHKFWTHIKYEQIIKINLQTCATLSFPTLQKLKFKMSSFTGMKFEAF